CVGLLPLHHGRTVAEGESWLFAAVVLLGLSLDTVVRGLGGTLDLVWTPGPWAHLTVVALLTAFAYGLLRATREPLALAATNFLRSIPLVGLGLFLFIEWLIIQNQGWVESFTGWPPAVALSWLSLGNVGAL